MLSGKSTHEFAFFQLKLPSQMLAAIECQVFVEVHFAAILLHIERGAAAGGLGPCSRYFSVLAANFERLAFLPFGSAFIHGVGSPNPAARQILRS